MSLTPAFTTLTLGANLVLLVYLLFWARRLRRTQALLDDLHQQYLRRLQESR